MGWSEFADCVSLSKVTLSEELKVIPMGTFSGDEALTEITIPASVTTIETDAFEGTGLKKVHVPDTVKVLENGVFGGCENLTEITLPSSMTEISNFFLGGTPSLKSVNIPAGVTKIGACAFMKSGIQKLNLPSGVTEIGERGFSQCMSLEEIYIPAGVKEMDESVFREYNNNLKIYYGGDKDQLKYTRQYFNGYVSAPDWANKIEHKDTSPLSMLSLFSLF